MPTPLTLEEVLALRNAVGPVLAALLPVRDAYKYPAPEYNAVNRMINAAVDVAEQAASAYVIAHIVPAPENPAPGFTAKLAEIAADLVDPAHLNWGEDADGMPAELTGRIYISINGATWYELADGDDYNSNGWISSDVDADPKGFSSKYEHCAGDVCGYML